MNKATELFEKIIVDGNQVNLQELEHNNGLFSLGTKKSNVVVEFTLKNKTEIPAQLFKDNVNIKSITIPGSVVKINEDVFTGSYITYINIPESVTYIDPTAFSGTSYLSYDSKQDIINKYQEYYTAEEANTYNLTLPGALQYGAVKVPEESYGSYWEVNGQKFNEDPTYQNSYQYDYIYDETSWNNSFQNGGLHIYYSDYPNEDLWNPTAHRAANFNDAVYVSYIYDNASGEGTPTITNLQAGWGETYQSLSDGISTYYITMNASVGDTLYEAFTDNTGSQSAGVYIKLFNKSYPSCTQCWEGAVNAPDAKYPWIVPHFENDNTGNKYSVIFKYDGKDDVRPWCNAKIFGKGNGHKVWGAASVAKEFNDNSFLIPINSGTQDQSTFDISKFKLILINALTGEETESKSFDYIYDETSWNNSFQNGALHIYYSDNPSEDLWNTEQHRAANFNDIVWTAEIYSDVDGTQKIGDAQYKATWGDPSQLLTDVEDASKQYYVNIAAAVDGNIYEIFNDSERTDSTGTFLKFTDKSYPSCTQCWEGAVNAPDAKYPWIAPYFDTDVNAILRFEYEGLDPVYPWGKDKLFGNVQGTKVWGAASVATEFNDNTFIIPENSGTQDLSTFDIDKFNMILEVKGVNYFEGQVISPEVLYTDAEVDEYNASLPGAIKEGDAKYDFDFVEIVNENVNPE